VTPGHPSNPMEVGAGTYLVRGTIRRAPTDQCGEFLIEPDPGYDAKLIYVACSTPEDEASWELLVGRHVQVNGTDAWRDHCIREPGSGGLLRHIRRRSHAQGTPGEKSRRSIVRGAWRRVYFSTAARRRPIRTFRRRSVAPAVGGASSRCP
jgi:hypothetical protein